MFIGQFNWQAIENFSHSMRLSDSRMTIDLLVRAYNQFESLHMDTFNEYFNDANGHVCLIKHPKCRLYLRWNLNYNVHSQMYAAEIDKQIGN